MKKIIYLFGTVLIISVLLFSCEKDVKQVELKNENSLNLRNDINNGNTDCTFVENGDLMRADIGYALALSLNNSGFKNAFAEKLNSVAESYGEASILFDQLENVQVGEGNNLLQILDENRNP